MPYQLVITEIDTYLVDFNREFNYTKKKGHYMPKDLTTYVQQVWASPTLEAKKQAMRELIEASHAKADTKRLFTFKVNNERNYKKLDSMASNYAMSGEGMKIK